MIPPHGRHWTDRHKFALIAAAMMIAVVLFFAALIGASMVYDSMRCDAYSASTGRDTKYVLMVGCMVKTPSGWLSQDELRQVIRADQPQK